MSDKEKLARIADRVNRYNLNALLEELCYHSNPGEYCRSLMQCYFFIAEEIVRSGEGTGEEMSNALSCLSLLIEAIDRMTDEPGELRVIAEPGYKDEAENSRDIIADLKAQNRILEKQYNTQTETISRLLEMLEQATSASADLNGQSTR